MPSPTKRPRPRTPDGRPPKRQQTSSPEEGEVDDGNAGASHPARSPLSNGNAKFRVPFPFKNKSNAKQQPLSLRDRISTEKGDGRWASGVYERPEEDGRRDEDPRRRREHDRRSFGGHGRRPGNRDMWTSSAADHYEPVPTDSYALARESSRSWVPRDRDSRSPPPRERRRDYSPVRTPSISPPYVPRSPSSRSLSPPDYQSRERPKHRLPTPRAPTRLSPPRIEYADSSPYTSRSSYSRDYYRDRERDPRGQYHRDDYDFVFERGSGRDAQKMQTSDAHFTRPRYSNSPTYRPRSPARHHVREPPTAPPPHSPRSDGARTPFGPPPPPLPPSKPVLPSGHDAEPMKPKPARPGAPLEVRTPPSMSLTAPGTRKPTPAPPKEPQVKPERSASPVVVKRKRTPVRRTREDEKDAYGRVFVGCGQRDDYDIMTKLGEGTFGEVHKALHKSSKELVALKRILMHNEKEGMPVTALREIKILKALRHPCIVELLDMFVIPSKGKETPMSVYMVFPYMDHDLAGLLENERVKLQPSQVKLYMKQLLEGTEYMHHNNILHRDMKAANLLISNNGSLRIADFGLARAFDPTIVTRTGRFKDNRERRYTNCVVTRWYRPPELLLGARQYGGEIDIWGIGCVLGEMFMRRPILPGNTDLDQLEKIWSICGSPNQQNWPDYDKLPGCEGQIRFKPQERRLKEVYESIGKETCDLLDKLLTLDPRERITASAALDHEYFWSDPLPADPKSLPMYESSHEFDQRGRRPHHRADPPKPIAPPFRAPNVPIPPSFIRRPPMPKPSISDSQSFPGIVPGFTGVNRPGMQPRPLYMPQSIPFPHPFSQPAPEWMVSMDHPSYPRDPTGRPLSLEFYDARGMPGWGMGNGMIPPPVMPFRPPGLPPRPGGHSLPPPMGKFGNPRPPMPSYREVLPGNPGGSSGEGLNYG